MATVIKRCAARRWTVFHAPSGALVLNVQEGPSAIDVASILLSEGDLAALVDRHASAARVDDLIARGRRIVPSLPTPPLDGHERLAA